MNYLKNQIIKLFQKPINKAKLDGSNPKLVNRRRRNRKTYWNSQTKLKEMLK
jgi:hypothetical protein